MLAIFKTFLVRLSGYAGKSLERFLENSVPRSSPLYLSAGTEDLREVEKWVGHIGEQLDHSKNHTIIGLPDSLTRSCLFSPGLKLLFQRTHSKTTRGFRWPLSEADL